MSALSDEEGATRRMKRLDRRKTLQLFAAAAAGSAAGRVAFAQTGQGAHVWTDMWGRALAGHDCVGYHARGEARMGAPEYEILWSGATWLFEGMESMKKFAHAPDRYAPMCGGHCVQSLAADRRLVGCDAEVWEIVDGRLAMFSSDAMRKVFQLDPAGGVAAASAAWRTFF